MIEEVACFARVVLTEQSERLTLRTECGMLPIGTALKTVDFQPGDLVEVRLLERCPQFGTTQWVQASRRG